MPSFITKILNFYFINQFINSGIVLRLFILFYVIHFYFKLCLSEVGLIVISLIIIFPWIAILFFNETVISKNMGGE